MKVLVLGGKGFIGRHITAALQQQGHQVVQGVSARHAQSLQPGDVVVDYARDTQADVWLPRLDGVDAVVNAVGVLRDTAQRPMRAVHTDTPAAVFEAARRLQLAHLVQVSSLGISLNTTPYGITKRAAEQALQTQMQAGLSATLVRPSVVFGKGGDSSNLFLNLARLPVCVLPAVAWRTQIQPVHVLELAQSIARILALPQAERPTSLDAVGPQAVPLSGFIASLRAQHQRKPALMLKLPDGLTKASAKVGDWVPVTPWGSEALGLLSHDNVADAAGITALLGRVPTHYSQLMQHA
ncbi:NAD-dependent epimerase/dehydratase family protein [Lampropedia puyangensis]|uniref:NAD-dependent epimerase/dehydratase family protein n=1 Tax=Lampropedia puyangensis TaxID=1330072 RepID=A0A4V4GRU4_9BURK|nr:NAD-dependent epimerase/dehydratase family protein [Lampropedia puyangensis]THU02796.1 NAD-dependent epimerase/dehydratase family protein [Lampropedia puyangensis]